MNYKMPEKILKNTNTKSTIISQYVLIGFAIFFLLLLIPFSFVDMTMFLIFFISACIIIPFLIGIPLSVLRKSAKIKNKIKNGQYKIIHETVVGKNYDELDEIFEDTYEESEDYAKIALRDDNGNIRQTSPRTTTFVDAKIGDEFFTIYLDGEEEPYTILTKEQYYATEWLYA